MLLPRVVRELLAPRRPSFAVLFVTHRCNARCAFCFNTSVGSANAPARRDELTREEYVAIAKANGPLLQVAIGGGEPFLRPDLDQIALALYRHAKVRLFSIPTNGSRGPVVLETVEAILRSAPRATLNLMVSLDAVGADHDELRGVPGLFERALALCHGLLALRRRHGNLNVIVNTTVSEHNLAGAAELIDFLAREFAGRPVFHNLSYDQRLETSIFTGRESLSRLLALERARERHAAGAQRGFVDRLIDRVYVDRVNALLVAQRLDDRTLYRCNAGRKLFVLQPDGAVSPCEPFLFEDRYADFEPPNIREHQYSYRAVCRDPGYQAWLDFIARRRCAPCPWSCAAITSLLYEPGNWARLLTVPRTSAALAAALGSTTPPAE